MKWGRAQELLELGFGMAHRGWKQRGPKWVRFVPTNETHLSHYEMVYGPTYPVAEFAGRANPSWMPSRCDLLKDGWYVHPDAPSPPRGPELTARVLHDLAPFKQRPPRRPPTLLA
jgi:hypothetical protein